MSDDLLRARVAEIRAKIDVLKAEASETEPFGPEEIEVLTRVERKLLQAEAQVETVIEMPEDTVYGGGIQMPEDTIYGGQPPLTPGNDDVIIDDGMDEEAVVPTPPRALTGSVGRGGRNAPDDVTTVQTLLNDHGAKLAVDGLVGPATIGAITAFQRDNTPVADGRVDPGGATWQALTGGAAPGRPEPGGQPVPGGGGAAAFDLVVTIVDTRGAGVPNLALQLIPDGDGPTQRRTTDPSGTALFEDVPSGRYFVDVPGPDQSSTGHAVTIDGRDTAVELPHGSGIGPVDPLPPAIGPGGMVPDDPAAQEDDIRRRIEEVDVPPPTVEIVPPDEDDALIDVGAARWANQTISFTSAFGQVTVKFDANGDIAHAEVQAYVVPPISAPPIQYGALVAKAGVKPLNSTLRVSRKGGNLVFTVITSASGSGIIALGAALADSAFVGVGVELAISASAAKEVTATVALAALMQSGGNPGTAVLQIPFQLPFTVTLKGEQRLAGGGNLPKELWKLGVMRRLPLKTYNPMATISVDENGNWTWATYEGLYEMLVDLSGALGPIGAALRALNEGRKILEDPDGYVEDKRQQLEKLKDDIEDLPGEAEDFLDKLKDKLREGGDWVREQVDPTPQTLEGGAFKDVADRMAAQLKEEARKAKEREAEAARQGSIVGLRNNEAAVKSMHDAIYGGSAASRANHMAGQDREKAARIYGPAWTKAAIAKQAWDSYATVPDTATAEQADAKNQDCARIIGLFNAALAAFEAGDQQT